MKRLSCNNLTSEQLDWLKNNYSIIGAKECSLKLGTTISFCYKLANKIGLKVSKHHKSIIAKNNAYIQFNKVREIRTEKSKNINIDSPEKAYVMGFLWGDGYLIKANENTSLYYIGTEILEEDMAQIKPFLGFLGTWNGYRRNRNKKPTFCAWLTDPVLGLFLKNNDYDKKSIVDPYKILSTIPYNLRSYWWRGYSDADGCFYIRKNKKHGCFTIAGNIKQKWDSLERLLSSLKVDYKIEKSIRACGSTSLIKIYDTEGIVTFGKYIYQNNSNICLNRKYEKFKDICSI